MFRRLRFTFSERWNKRNRLLLERLANDSAARSAVREIYLNGSAGNFNKERSKEQKWVNQQLRDLIPQLFALKVFMYVLILVPSKQSTRKCLYRA